MLRQQLEPFASNELLTQQSHITISMSKESNLPSTSDSQKEDEGGFAFQWISVVARGILLLLLLLLFWRVVPHYIGTTSLYFDRITQIETLSELGAQQLQADIGKNLQRVNEHVSFYYFRIPLRCTLRTKRPS